LADFYFRKYILLPEKILRMIIIYILQLVLYTGCLKTGIPDLKFEKLLVEYAENPVNLDMAHPRFSWIISSEGRGRRQTAYRIIVSSSLKNLKSDKPDLWDSGKTESGETIQHEYLPDNLLSESICFWKVVIWDENGRSLESPCSKFVTAFLPGYDWSAGWIGNKAVNENVPAKGFFMETGEQKKTGDTIDHDGCSLLLRHEMDITRKIESARIFITGLGYYEFFINGNRVGDHILAPAKTPYNRYILYDTYDISSLVTEGRNAFGIHLGNGWYNPYKKWWNMYRMQWFGSKKAIAEIHLKYTDGTTSVINTDSSWLWSYGPVIYNCVYDGEVCNANMEKDGWTKPGYDDSEWQKVSVFSNYRPRLISSRMPAIRIRETFKPRELIERGGKGVRVFDMGQNFAGWIRIEVTGQKMAILKIRFAEDIKPDSTIDISSNENAGASAEYILKGSKTEVYEPRFTCFGFRYVEVTSSGGPVEIKNIEGEALYSDNRISGVFGCNNPLVSKIHNATLWSQKSNMAGYPMDCPQRDERLGWLGDAQVTAEEAMYNFDMALFYENWLEGIMENQDKTTGDIPIISPRPYIKDEGIEWSSTYFSLLWQYYVFYGDKRILSSHYPAMKRYMQFLDSISNDRILPKGWIGDWGSMVEGWKEGEPASVPTAFYYQNATIMSEIAALLQMNDEREYFEKLASDIRIKYNKAFLNKGSANYDDGSQMANSFPLYLGIVSDSMKSEVLNNLLNDIVVDHKSHLTTGVLGTKYMPEVLAREGHADIAWKIINQKSFPCWNDMMRKYTTMCEFWTLKQSKNHVMMGSIDAWFYKYIAGIQTDRAGTAFSSFIVKPFIPDSLSAAKAIVSTIRGRISSEWTLKGDRFTLSVEVPFNTVAKVYVPGNPDGVLRESGIPVSESVGIEYLGYADGYHKMNVSSGTYMFMINRSETEQENN
jgi:alpha-L-rhamnosidase